MPSRACFEGQELVAYDFERRSWIGLQREVRQAGRRYPLRCVVCAGPMYCRMLPPPYLTPIFVHCPGYGHDCLTSISDGESADHYALKGHIHKTVSNTKGWLSRPEVELGKRRPDIVATRTDGLDDCCVFEIQLSPISVAEVTARQADHAPHCRQSSWVVRELPTWLYDVPAYRTAVMDGTETVTKGLVTWEGGLDGAYIDATIPLSKVTRMVLGQRIAHHAALGWVSLDDASNAARAARKKAQERNNREVLTPPRYRNCDRAPAAPPANERLLDLQSRDAEPRGDWLALSKSPMLPGSFVADQCVVCEGPVVVSASYQLALHHSCAARFREMRRDCAARANP